MPFGIRQAARIVGVDIYTVEQQRERTDIVDANTELGITKIFPRATVVTEPLSGETGAGNGVVDITGVGTVTGRPGGLDAITPGAVAAEVRTGLNAGRLLAGFGFHIHHAAGGVTVERGKRAT
ncbi:hypothetical protein D3C78_1153790 [compost metagenome]